MKIPSRFSLAVLGVAVTLLSGCSQEEQVVTESPVRPVKLFTVEDYSKRLIRNFPASVAATDEAEISFRISGELVERPLAEGMLVNKGQLLARMDDKDARNTLADRQANYELAVVDFKRKKDLVAKKALAQSQLDTAEATLKSTRAALELARSNLTYTRIVAPFSGRIAKLEVENYQFVQARQTVVVLQSDDTVDLHIQVPESVIASIGQMQYNFEYQPEVRFHGTQGKSFRASYKERSNKVSPGTQSYEVVFTMDKPKEMNILPGMAATMTIDFSKAVKMIEDVGYVIVPRQSIAKEDTSGRTVVWTYDDTTGLVQSADVTMGRVTNEGVAIISGLKPGDRIVAAGASQMTENLKVKPLRWERGL